MSSSKPIAIGDKSQKKGGSASSSPSASSAGSDIRRSSPFGSPLESAYSAYSGYHEGNPRKISSSEENRHTSISFTTKEEVGVLQTALAFFTKHGVSLQHIESKPSEFAQEWQFIVTVPSVPSDPKLQSALSELRAHPTTDKVEVSSEEIPWFPRFIADLDYLAHKVFSYGSELSSDHPGFSDEVYRKRRLEICAISTGYKHGTPIPRITYNEKEVKTWGAVYSKLKALYPTHACAAHNRVFPLLEQFCGYAEDNIPQLDDISKFLKSCTGWSLRPVTGLLTPRDFLNGLAHRVFHSTQYIRHHSKPFYTPEPDVCHELLGHVPLFADPDFADFSQEIGLASLGASDADIEKLATVYWFTVEFGLCKESDQEGKKNVKAFGAGLLSSFGELEYALTDKPKLLAFDPERVCTQKYPITEYQPLYFVADSFERMKQQMKAYASTLSRPFSVHYNAYTQSVEILDTEKKIARLARKLQYDMGVLASALTTLSH